MNTYEVIRFLHVLSAVALLGASAVGLLIIRAALRRARLTQEIRAYMSVARPLLAIEPAAALGLLATGIYLTSAAGFWTLSWVQVAAVFWVVNSIVAGTTVKPVMGRMAAAAATAADGPVTPHLDSLRSSSRLALGGDFLVANDAAMLYLMAMRPGLIGSLATVAVTNIVVAATRAARFASRR